MMPTALFYLPPQLAIYYPHCTLDASDQARLAKSPALAQRLSWQTSRVGKHLARQHYPNANLCLSHKKGHSLIAISADKSGVDLEDCHTRDYLALAEKICSTEEIAYLRNCPSNLRNLWFYRLWTIKEALIKAQNLTFPTEMRDIGLTWQNQQAQIRLKPHTASCSWLSAQFADNWIFSALWFCHTSQIILHTPTTLTLLNDISCKNIQIQQQALPEFKS